MDRCKWFLFCENVAETTEPHPVLGNVPICTSCASWLKRMKGVPRETHAQRDA